MGVEGSNVNILYLLYAFWLESATVV